jgi:protein-disulfide isomerase
MSRGSAWVSILFAFFVGLVVGKAVDGPGGSGETAEIAAADDTTGAAAPAEAGGPERFKIPVTAAQPSKGAPDALVTIVEFSDFQCPFCSRVEPTISQLLNDYKGKLRVVWRNNPLPFHQAAGPAAELAIEAFKQGGSEKFWATHKLLFDNQRALERPQLEQYAQQLGLDMAKVKAALDGHTHQASISEDQALSARVGARGTPAFFINGRFLSGAQPIENFKTIIDDEIARADKLVKAGVARNRIYAELTKGGLTAAKAAEPGAAGNQPAQPRRMPDPNAVYKVPVGDSAQKGPSDALVTIVEFSEFQCPFCSRVLPTTKQIVETYGRDVRIVFKHNPLPFHKDAGPASQLALEAHRQGKFWEAHDLLFENQRALTREDLEKYAQQLGLNMAKVRAALDGETYKAAIEADQTLARSLGASGTPSFFINGRNLRGAQPFEAFKAVIDEELAKAKALVAAGTPRARVYEKTIENGATEAKFIEAPAAPGGAAPQQPQAAPDANKIYNIAVPRNAPRKGGANAKVVIQEFSDFQCPFCSRVNPTVKQIMEKYGDKVAIIWRNYPLPFHQEAGPAAEAAMEAFAQGGSTKFWAMHDLLFENQRALSRADLDKYAAQIGLNAARFKAAMDNHTHKASVDADMAAVTQAGAQIGTPSFFINGKLLQGAQPFPAFEAAIDAALAAN